MKLVNCEVSISRTENKSSACFCVPCGPSEEGGKIAQQGVEKSGKLRKLLTLSFLTLSMDITIILICG